MDLKPDMTFDWKPDASKQQSYLLKKQIGGKPNDRVIEQEIEKLMMHEPVAKQETRSK